MTPEDIKDANARSARRAAVKAATASERERCAGIAKLAAQFAPTDATRGVAEAILAAIENDAI